MKYLLLLSGLLFLIPSLSWATPSKETTPPFCTAAALATGDCAANKIGTRVAVTLATVDSCTTTGGFEYICENTGGSWVKAPNPLFNGDDILNFPDGTFDFTRDEAGTVTLTASDDNAVAALTVLPGGAEALTLGGASTTSTTITTDGGSIILDGTLVGTGTGGFGWTVQTGVNTACTTTCITPAVFGVDSGATGLIVGPSDATAEECLCAGGS